MFGYRIDWDAVQNHVNRAERSYRRVQEKLVQSKNTVKEIVAQPETKLILKAAAKSIGGGAAIGVGAGVALHNVPVLAVLVGIGGGGLWGYHCGKQLDNQLLELRLKQITENPQLMTHLEEMFKAQANKQQGDSNDVEGRNTNESLGNLCPV